MVFLEPARSTLEETKDIFKGITPEWAWGGSTGKDVKVGIVDSGIDYTHPELTGCVKNGVEVTTSSSGEIDYKMGLHQDAFGHGTACAGIIRSIAPEVEIYSIKVLGGALTGTGNVMMAGIKWAVDNGMDLANLSLGTTKDVYYGNLHKIADDAYFKKCH
ncbi:MAG TPA: S8 family serine peptidase, partial [Candidatus Eremiobacteraeota bacterium]|nr:S8 family serine peptidase [Candidatus Eremiobacteraeota bacterium]